MSTVTASCCDQVKGILWIHGRHPPGGGSAGAKVGGGYTRPLQLIQARRVSLNVPVLREDDDRGQ